MCYYINVRTNRSKPKFTIYRRFNKYMEKIFKLWTTPRARYFKTLEEATAAADQIRRKTGYILCITTETRK